MSCIRSLRPAIYAVRNLLACTAHHVIVNTSGIRALPSTMVLQDIPTFRCADVKTRVKVGFQGQGIGGDVWLHMCVKPV